MKTIRRTWELFSVLSLPIFGKEKEIRKGEFESLFLSKKKRREGLGGLKKIRKATR